jgi:hypothetical protein
MPLQREVLLFCKNNTLGLENVVRTSCGVRLALSHEKRRIFDQFEDINDGILEFSKLCMRFDHVDKRQQVTYAKYENFNKCVILILLSQCL